MRVEKSLLNKIGIIIKYKMELLINTAPLGGRVGIR